MSRVGFAQVPDWFLREAVPSLGVSAFEVAAYVAIVGRADANGSCFPSYDLIAHEAGMSRNTAAKAVKGLASHGLIAIVAEGNGTTHRYRVMPKPPLPPVPEVRRKENGRPKRRGNRHARRSPTQDVGTSPTHHVGTSPTQEVGRSTESPTQEVGRTHPADGSAPTHDVGTKYTHQEDPGSTHSDGALTRAQHRDNVIVMSTRDQPREVGFRWGYLNTLTREHWDIYLPEFVRVYGREPLASELSQWPSASMFEAAMDELRAKPTKTHPKERASS